MIRRLLASHGNSTQLSSGCPLLRLCIAHRMQDATPVQVGPDSPCLAFKILKTDIPFREREVRIPVQVFGSQSTSTTMLLYPSGPSTAVPFELEGVVWPVTPLHVSFRR